MQKYTYQGETHTIHGWAKTFGLSAYYIKKEIANGKTPQEAIEHSFRKRKTKQKTVPEYLYKGKRYNLKQITQEFGIPAQNFKTRMIRKNWTIDRAIETPIVDTHKGEVKPLHPGDRFGRLTVLRFHHDKTYTKGNRLFYYECLCDCGNLCIKSKYSLQGGTTVSCGCQRNENVKKARFKHGLTNDRVFEIWHKMVNFSKNQAVKPVELYPAWNDFYTFYLWLKEQGYSGKEVIRRKDKTKGFNPENCYIIDKDKADKPYFYDGKYYSLNGLAAHINVSVAKLKNKLNRGYTIEEINNLPKREINKLYEYQGNKMTVVEISKLTGIRANTIRRRLKSGCPIEFAANPNAQYVRYNQGKNPIIITKYEPLEQISTWQKTIQRVKDFFKKFI